MCVRVPLDVPPVDFTIGLGEYLCDRLIELLLKPSKAFLPFACEVDTNHVKGGASDRSEEHTSELRHSRASRMPSSA